MAQPFGDAVKAAVAEKLWATRDAPNGVSAYRDIARAGQYLFRVMEEDQLNGDITALTIDHLTRAIPSHLAQDTQTTIAYGLRTLARIWAEAGIAPQLEDWEFDRIPSAKESRLENVKARRNLTHDEVCAIAEAFHRAKTPYEQVITSVLALLCCAPSRMEEALILPEQVEIVERPGEYDVPAEQSFHKDNRFRFGLRWWPSKGGPPMIKFVPAEMVPVAIEALSRLRTHTATARELAKWMDKNPGVMPLPCALSHVRDCGEITTAEILQLFERDVQRYKKFRPFRRLRNGVYDFFSVEDWWRAQRPNGWPILSERSGVKYSNALLVFNRYQLGNWATDPTQIEMLTEKQIGAALSPNPGQPSIFERLGVRLPDGSFPRITTHQIRHYLNTIAQRANVPQAHIAYWSGRKSVMQNRDYDHTDILDVVDQIMARGVHSEVAQSVPVIVSDGDGTDMDLLEASIRTNVHSTPFGFCVGNLTYEPCSRAMTCTTCTRLVCVVGNMDQTANIEADILRRRKSVENLKAMDANGRKVNPRMKAQMEAQLKHGEMLLSMMIKSENEGAVIRNSGAPGLMDFSHSVRAFESRKKRNQECLFEN